MNASGIRILAVLAAVAGLHVHAFAAGPDDSRKANSSSSNLNPPSSGTNTSHSPTEDIPATDPAYQLSKGDEIALNVFNEGALSSVQKIDNRGIIRLPYNVGEVSLAGKTVREAETFMENLLVEKRLLKKPMVTIGVRDYASREVTLLGAVGRPGKFPLPKEARSMEIVELFEQIGGLDRKARGDSVQITRILDSGEERTITVDVEGMLNPRKASRNTPRSFLVYPGDRINVPERIW